MTGALVSSLLNGGSGSGGGVSTKKVIIKSATLPTASEKTLGAMYIYAGEDTTDLKHGYIYEGRSIAANTKEVEFSTNTISCSGTDFWELVKTLAPSNYTEIVKGEMVLVGGNTWRIVGRNTNDEQVLSYQQYDADFESAGFVFNGTFSEGDTVPFVCEINETAATQYVWRRIDVQPSSSKGQVIAVDAELSPTSENPVQNKAIAGALGVDWVKPDDWVDIRSGALPNSMYLLVGHAADYSSYSSFVFKATVSNSGSYDVYVDGIKQATTANNTDTTLNWQTLALTSGWDVTYPSAMRTHIVRVTPSVSTNKITGIYYTGDSDGAALWIHNTVDGVLNLGSLSGKAWSAGHLILLEAITTVGEQIATNGLNQAFAECPALKELPMLDLTNNTADLYRTFANCASLKKIKLQNSKGNNATSLVNGCTSLEEIKAKNSSIKWSTSIFDGCTKLKSLGELQVSSSDNFTTNSLRGCVSLSELFLDLSNNASMTRLAFGGASDKRIDGLKGLTVSPEAPFSSTTSPQLELNYTGLDRRALVNLFKSMPYNVAYTKVGTPIFDGSSVSGFSSSNYLQIQRNNDFYAQNSFEFVIKFKAGTSTTSGTLLGFGCRCKNTGSEAYYGFYTNNNNGGTMYCGFDPSNNMVSYSVSFTAGTDYYLKWSKQNGTLYIHQSSDGVTWTELANDGGADNTTMPSANYLKPIYFFRNSWPDSSVDLNNTYGKINGVPWFGPGVTRNLVPDGTVVGSPTIEDGLLLMPNASNRVMVSSMQLSNKPFEIGSKIKLNSLETVNYSNYGSGSYLLPFYVRSNAIDFLFRQSSNDEWYEARISQTPVVDTWYWWKIIHDGNGLYTFKISINNSDWITATRSLNSPLNFPSMTYLIGVSSSNVSPKAIDLKETYIKVNGNMWFAGMIPQVKTCSVVGCTGTADLTQTDKDIVLDKGWSLTVA